MKSMLVKIIEPQSGGFYAWLGREQANQFGGLEVVQLAGTFKPREFSSQKAANSALDKAIAKIAASA